MLQTNNHVPGGLITKLFQPCKQACKALFIIGEFTVLVAFINLVKKYNIKGKFGDINAQKEFKIHNFIIK